MVSYLRERDYRVIGGLAALFVLGSLLRITVFDSLPFSVGPLLLFLELLGALALLYGIMKGRRKWSGELARLIDILSLAVIVILVMQTLSALTHFTPSAPLMDVARWEEAISAGNALGMLIAAYGFYEFSNAPWFHER